jgi:type II secretion system (T2SS) protein F
MSPEPAAALAAVAVLLTARPRRGPRRLARLRAGRTPASPSQPSVAAVPVVAAAAAVVLGAAVGVWAAVCAAGVVVVVGRRRPRAAPQLDVPLVADLVAACLAAGAAVGDALRAAAETSPGAARICLPVADRLASGAAPAEAWADWLARPELAPMARACVRAADSGAATTLELRRAGDRVRMQRRAELTHRAHRAAVWAVLPLGLCFLPAFVLVGIVPFALGLFGR